MCGARVGRAIRSPATTAAGVLAMVIAGCATSPSETRSNAAATGDCPSESSAPMARELALEVTGLAADALLPGASLLITAAELVSHHGTGAPRLAPTGFVNTPSGRVAVYRSGHRGPTLVLQSGLGDGMEPWSVLVSELGDDQAVFAYDRPGYGDSRPVPGTRDPCTIATELHGLLSSADVPPPYLLVGHSLGGLYQYAFARRYPEDVAGLLLLDPTHPEHWPRMSLETPAAAAMLKTLRATVFTETQRRELDHQADCLADSATRPTLRVPSRLLVRTRYESIEQGRFEAMVHTLEADWESMVGAPAVERVCSAGHYIQRDQPRVVLQALTELVAATAR